MPFTRIDGFLSSFTDLMRQYAKHVKPETVRATAILHPAEAAAELAQGSRVATGSHAPPLPETACVRSVTAPSAAHIGRRRCAARLDSSGAHRCGICSPVSLYRSSSCDRRLRSWVWLMRFRLSY